MNTADLYRKLVDEGRLSAGLRRLRLDMDYLDSLSSARFEIASVKDAVCCYFPQGAISVVEIRQFNAPSQGERIKLTGKGDLPPFLGLSLDIEMWSEEKRPGVFELKMAFRAYGVNGNRWTMADGFPFYRNSLLGDISFVLSGDPTFPLLTLASHDVPGEGIPSGLSCRGLLDADSLRGENLRLFLGDAANGKYVPVFGTITASRPEGPYRKIVRPLVSIYGGFPEQPERWKLGGLFPVENIRYSLKGTPNFSAATRRWEVSCALLLVADLVVTPVGPAAENAPSSYKIPIGVEIHQQEGAIRFWSDLQEGLSLAWNLLARSIPGTTLRIPTNDFQLQDLVKLTRLEMLASRNNKGELYLDWVSLNVETNLEKNRWALIDGLLTLDAIDFDILVRTPSSNPQIAFTLSGLFRIGKEGLLRLSTDFEITGGSDYAFGGQLLENSKVNIKEILTHFLGHSQHPDLPEIEVYDFSFSVQPKSKVYEGEILLAGNWGIPGLAAFSLHDVFFRLSHAGEGETEFEAVGVFELGGAQLSVSADYVSGGQGWTFAGGTYEKGKVPIGQWLVDMGRLLGLRSSMQPPTPLQGLELSDLGARFNTATKDFSFHGTAEFPIDGKAGSGSSARLTVQADLRQQTKDGAHALTLGGMLHLFGREFAVGYGSHGDTGLLVAAYDNPKGDVINLSALIEQISKNTSENIKENITLSLKHAQFAFGKTGDASKFLFGVELDAGIELSRLPLVGALFDRSQTLSVVFQVLALNAKFNVEEVREINRLTAPGVTKLPEEEIDVSKGKVQLKAAVRLGEISRQLALPLETSAEKKEGEAASTEKTSPAIRSTASSRIVKWVDVQKAFGPFHFQRVGIGLDGPNIDFLLDASLETAGLTITLEGLAAECALAELSQGNFKPTFHLDGLGIDFRRGELEIGGALLRVGEGQYDGALTLHYKKLGIQAFGSYRKVGEHPSLFIYALVDYPIGGPPFFFVEGLALGFGYNRTMKIPTIDQVGEFPLVKHAMATAAAPKTPMEVVAELGEHIPFAVGEYFLTAGVRFSSFKNINGFVLLTALFGQHFEIDVLGKATVSSPPNDAEPLVSASLALLARFAPDEGELKVMAKLLPDAYVFSRDCHLTGGFAFCCWFGEKNKGDFVLTLGGYHKSFDAPAHYPRVPRLGVNWKVNANLTVTADAYFALTPSALMAGGNLSVVWQSGHLKAWFMAGVDFLIGWRPFHYRGRIGVSIGASYSFQLFGWRTVSVELAADLMVWGPPFSGIAHVKWFVISFDVAFGDATETLPEPIKEWETFRAAFLPEKDAICTIAAQAGKAAPHGSQPVTGKPNVNKPADLGVVNPRQLCIVVSSAAPVTKTAGALLAHTAASPALGVAPMNKRHGDWDCLYEIKIERNGHDVSSLFRAEALTQSVPAALWDEEIDPGKRNRRLIDKVVCGYEIQPANPFEAPHPPVAMVRMTNSPDAKAVESQGGCRLNFPPPGAPVRDLVKDSVQTPETRQRRQEVLADLLPVFDPEFTMDWSGVTVESWRAAPTLVRVEPVGIINDPVTE